MIEGEIIKFYRQKVGFTQEQLCSGICSVTHISKIERGTTAYSSEIIELFSERLQIDIQKEISRFQNLGKILHRWHRHIMMQQLSEVEKTKQELEQIPFIKSSKYAPLYKLLFARYHIMQGNPMAAHEVLKEVYGELSPYDSNLLKHVWGIYYLVNYKGSGTSEHKKAIRLLKGINLEEYPNKEYYYHLAVAYHFIHSKVMAYAYAEKALEYFKETNNFIWSINTETLMLMQMGDDQYLDYEEMKERYHHLILDCEKLNALDKKARLLNNWGFECLKRKEYEEAQKYFNEALKFVKPQTVEYLLYLNNYVKGAVESGILKRTQLLSLIQKGIALAKNLDSPLYKTLFKIHQLRVEQKNEEYYHYLEHLAIPFFYSNNHSVLTNRHGKELYQYFVSKGEYEKAVLISNMLIEGI